MKWRRIPLALLQLTHEPIRLAVAALGVTFAVVLMLIQMGLQESLNDSGVMVHQQLQGDLMLMDARSRSINVTRGFTRRRLAQALAVPGVQAVSSLSVSLLDWKNPVTGTKYTVFVMGCDGRESFLALSSVAENWEQIQRPEAVLYDRDSRSEYGPVVERFLRGDRVTSEVNGKNIRVAGLFSMGSSFTANGNLLMSGETFQRITERPVGVIDIGVVKLAASADRAQVQRALQALYTNDLKVMTRDELCAMEIDYLTNELSVGFIFQMGVIIGFLVGTVIVYQILFTDVARHLPEYATLKAMGYTDFYLFGIVFKESLILSVAGFLPGLLAAWWLYGKTAEATALPMRLKFDIALLVFALTVVMCSVSGFLAMRKLREADPADVF